MSGIKAPLLDIMNRLATLDVVNPDLQPVKLPVRVWNDQVNQEAAGKLAAYQKPAAFVEVVNNPVYQTIGSGFQSADVTWRIHLVDDFYDAQDGTMEQNLRIFDLRDSVVKLLHRFEPVACGPIVRVAEGQEVGHTNIYEYIIEFMGNFIDSKGSPYDPFPGQFIDKAPPTDLEENVNVVDAVNLAVPGSAPENVESTFQSSFEYKIPKS